MKIKKGLYFYVVNSLRILNTLAFMYLLTACSNATPEMKSSNSIAAPTANSISISSPSDLKTISGTCDKRVSALDISSDNGNTFVPAEGVVGGGLSMNCQTSKTYSMNFAVGTFLGLNSPNTAKNLVLRGRLSKGYTGSGSVNVTYDAVTNSITNGVASGSAVNQIAGATYVARGRVGTGYEHVELNSANYKVKVGVRHYENP